MAISDGETDRNKSAYAIHSVTGTLVTSDLNTLPADYLSIDMTGTDVERSADGRLPELDFMHIASGNSKLIDQGSVVRRYKGESRHSQGISYNGIAPDLGCFETDGQAAGIGHITTFTASRRIGLTPTVSGLVVVTIAGAKADDCYTLILTDASGRLLGRHEFIGSRTTIALPAVATMAVVTVSGRDLKETVKVTLR